MHYTGDLTVQVKDISLEFRAWHAYITNELHVEANNLSI